VRGSRAAALVAGLGFGLVAGTAVAQTTGGPKTFSAKDVIEGTKVSREACARTPKAVFVTSFGEGICIRYYLAGEARGKSAVVFFTGDVLGLDAKGRREVDPGYLTQAPEYIDIASRVWTERLGAPVIFFGRMGLNGSSGWHGDRRTALEVDVTARALDAIAAKEGLAGFHLVGQSGGAMLVPPLVAVRDDVGCAVIASGPLDFRAFARAYGITFRESGPRGHADPMAVVPKVAAATSRADPTRLFLLTDPKDRAVPAVYQWPFAVALARAGGRATAIRTEGRDVDHHALIEKALFVAGDCIAGRPDAEILGRWEGRAGNDLPR
jgi:pimeloyl-ACP methyl ester carboxylesterase